MKVETVVGKWVVATMEGANRKKRRPQGNSEYQKEGSSRKEIDGYWNSRKASQFLVLVASFYSLFTLALCSNHIQTLVLGSWFGNILFSLVFHPPFQKSILSICKSRERRWSLASVSRFFAVRINLLAKKSLALELDFSSAKTIAVYLS